MVANRLAEVLHQTIDNNLSVYLKALEHFKEDEHFVYPLTVEDFWLKYRKGPEHEFEQKKLALDMLTTTNLVKKDEVSYVVGFQGNVLYYELTKEGEKLFEEVFGTSPKMCYHPHYATTH